MIKVIIYHVSVSADGLQRSEFPERWSPFTNVVIIVNKLILRFFAD